MASTSNSHRLPLIDWLKALASQLIVWHHLAFYGPLSDVVEPHAPGLMAWLYDSARMAVQVFLVAGGFLAARSLGARAEGLRLAHYPGLLWRRYRRLIPLYLTTAACAIAAGALARALIVHRDVPAAPQLSQLAAHVFLLQDLLGLGSVSAGMWYVAIDFQLYAVLALAIVIAGRRAWLPAAALAAAALFRFNRQPQLDVWAIYFFGSYGLGACVAWLPAGRRRWIWCGLLAVAVAAALAVEWRTRLCVAGLTVLLLALPLNAPAPGWVAWLSRHSYAIFLIHYPVLVAAGAVVYRLWPASVAANALGMAAVWLLSLGAGALLQRAVEPATAGSVAAGGGPVERGFRGRRAC